MNHSTFRQLYDRLGRAINNALQPLDIGAERWTRDDVINMFRRIHRACPYWAVYQIRVAHSLASRVGPIPRVIVRDVPQGLKATEVKFIVRGGSSDQTEIIVDFSNGSVAMKLAGKNIGHQSLSSTPLPL